MIDSIIHQISNDNLQKFFHGKISSFRPEFTERKVEGYDDFTQLVKLGEAEYPNTEELLVFSCRYRGELSERSSKKRQFELAKWVLKEDFKDGAIFIFYGDEGKFRFSFIRKNYGDQEAKYTPWRRYTYFVEPTKANKTFRKRIGQFKFNSLDEIQEAFSVEKLSKQFYSELSHWYFYALTQVEFPNDQNHERETVHANALIRLITRIMFVWFMKQKGLVPDDFFDKSRVDHLLNYDDKTGSTYYKAILQNLFFATLNTPRDKGRLFVNRQYGVQNFYRYKRFLKDTDLFLNLMDGIPFLNGGLFENLDIVRPKKNEEIRIDCFSDRKDNENRLKVPDYLFFGETEADVSSYLGTRAQKVPIIGLIELLKRYDFTIDENTPFDQDVALDPEMLGLVFENLLASFNPETEQLARKESGSFYTPRVVVDYMVEESLVATTSEKTGLELSKLKLLFKDNDEQPFDKEEEKTSIVKALSEVKILDPACGSGAFPMGALQKLVHVLSMIDPDNQLWQERQKEKAIQETTAASNIGDREERKSRLENIERAFTTSLNDPDYARKLFLIENCLFGVDIQPVALQITKLRFFISLLVDQKVDDKDSNFGVLPLPNLETKFVAANSLIHIPGAEERERGLLRSHKMIDLERDLEDIRRRVFNARTPKTKEKYRQEHLQIQQKISRELINLGYPNEQAEAIKEWNAFNLDKFSDWFDPDWMFGLTGFDIVIGNPPYIQLQKELPGREIKYADLYKDEGYQTFERTGDIYTLFYERGLRLLNDSGFLCFITSNKWMRAKYGKSLRKFLCKYRPLILMDLGPGIFEAATVDTNILLVQKLRPNKQTLKSLKLQDKAQISAISDRDWVSMNNLSEESWIILQPEEVAIRKKIEQLGTPLKNWDVRINRGVLTGYNKAFIIDGKKKDELIAEDPRSAEILKPILRGRDIKRYRAEFADLWLINTHNGYKLYNGKEIPAVEVRKYPAIKNHLDQYNHKLKPRSDQGATPYNLRNCAYLEEFEVEKIVWKRIGSAIRFSLSNSSEMCLDSTVIMTGKNVKYLCGVLNSKLLIRELLLNSPKTGTGDVIISVQALNPLLIIKPTKEIIDEFVNYVDIILRKKASGEDSSGEERQIDLMVYKLYKLTYEEVKLVDPETTITREEYKNFAKNYQT